MKISACYRNVTRLLSPRHELPIAIALPAFPSPARYLQHRNHQRARPNQLRKIALALSAIAALTNLARSADQNWNVSTGDWSVATNWTPFGVPTATSGVLYIDNGGTASISGTQQAFQLFVADDNTTVTSRVNIAAGATLSTGVQAFSNAPSVIGNFSNTSGEVTVRGIWDNTYAIYVGNSGVGSLSILDGGKVTGTLGDIGRNSSGAGTVLIEGMSSRWDLTGELDVTRGTMTLSNGGVAANAGFGIIRTGTANVTGAGSLWQAGSQMRVGTSFGGMLNVSTGGKVTNGDGYIGYQTTASATVGGTNSLWQNSGNLTVGYFGTGTLTINGGGQVDVGGSGGAGTVNLSSAGSSSYEGTINIGAAPAAAAVEAGRLNASEVNGQNFNSTINFNHTGTAVTNYAFTARISGNARINAVAGLTRLTSANTYDEGTIIGGNTGAAILRAETATALGTGQVTVKGNGTLEIAHTLTSLSIGNTTFENAGKLALTLSLNDAAPAALQIGGVLNIAATAGSPFVMEISLPGGFSAAGYDWTFLTATGGIGGSLANFTVNNPNFMVLQRGDSLAIVAVPEPGSTSALIFGALALATSAFRGLRQKPGIN